MVLDSLVNRCWQTQDAFGAIEEVSKREDGSDATRMVHIGLDEGKWVRNFKMSQAGDQAGDGSLQKTKQAGDGPLQKTKCH